MTTIYWSPSFHWRIDKNNLKIGVFSFKDNIYKLFPEFYFQTIEGTTIDKLKKKFSDFNQVKLSNFIHELKKRKIIVTSLLTPSEVFYPQNYLFENPYDEKIKFDMASLEKFKETQLNRNIGVEAKEKIVLSKTTSPPEFIQARKTYRDFNKTAEISFIKFSELISIFQQYKINESTKYFYASAGGLYPIDIYIFVKEKRVEKVPKGLYNYNPIKNDLQLINADPLITKESQFTTNQSIFEASAFTIYFIYNAKVTMPKYGGMAYYYAILDCGIMLGTITPIAELNNIGLCSIGDMEFYKIQDQFKLNKDQVYLHSIEVGLKPIQVQKIFF